MGESKRQPVDNCRWLLSPAKSGKPWELEATQPLIRHQIVRPVGRPLYLAIAGVQAVGEPIAMDGSPRALWVTEPEHSCRSAGSARTGDAREADLAALVDGGLGDTPLIHL